MPTKLSKDQFWKLYEGLPQELKDSIFSSETAEYIQSICSKNNVNGDKRSDIASIIGDVLLGILLPEDFEKTIKKDLKLTTDTAKNVSHEINRFIFYPVKDSLAGLHKIEVAPTNGMPIPTTLPKPATKPIEAKISETPTAPKSADKKADLYKEDIE